MNRAAIAALVLTLALPAVALAHALGAEAKLKDGKVTVEAFYDDDTPSGGAKVTVTSAEGKTVAEGKTDTSGKWAFDAPLAGKYKVVVNAGDGHKATITLTIPGAAVPQLAPGAQPADPGAPDAATTVSEGPTRSEFTGPMRLVWAAVGLVVIGGATWAVTRLVRATKGGSAP